jgi:hypothetical protein
MTAKKAERLFGRRFKIRKPTLRAITKYSSEQHPAKEFHYRCFPTEDSAGLASKFCDPDRKKRNE